MERIVKGIWVPIEIWQDTELCWNEKILLMEIDSFTSKGRECYISNEYICNLLGVAKRTAQVYLAHLLERELVNVVRFDGRVRYLESNLSVYQQDDNSLHGRDEENRMADVQKSAPLTCKNLHHTNSNSYLNKVTNKERNNTNSIKERKFDFRQGLIDAGVSGETADQWLQVRRTKRATNSEIALKDTLSEIAKSGASAEQCIRTAVARSWSGFRAEWLEREQGGSSKKEEQMDATTYMWQQIQRRRERQQQQQEYNPLDDLPLPLPDEQ